MAISPIERELRDKFFTALLDGHPCLENRARPGGHAGGPN